MGLVLIHIRPGLGPVGAWRIVNDRPQAYYPDPDSAVVERARLALAARGDAVPWDEWLYRLAERIPYLDDFEAVEVGEDVPMHVVLADVARAWTAHH